LGGNPSRAEQLDWWINAYTTRYDGEVFGVDFNVGRILDYLEDNGLLNNTVVVVTSDHGEAFGEHDYYNDHGDLLYEDQVWIPLVIYDRGIALRSDRLSLNTQLMPTVLDILDITDSFSRAPSLFSDKRLPVLIFESDRCISPDVNNNSCYPVNSTVGKLIATRKGRFKYIHTPTKAGRVEELYDLESDVGELNNLTGSLGVESVLEELRQVVGGVEPLVHDPLNDVVQVDLETVEVLRSLGYVV
jgi:arylsulfatase A-like enzyme